MGGGVPLGFSILSGALRRETSVVDHAPTHSEGRGDEPSRADLGYIRLRGHDSIRRSDLVVA